MKFHSLIVENFFDRPWEVRRTAKKMSYGNLVNPLDKVEYPNISAALPDSIHEEMISKLEALLGRKIKSKITFLRLSPEGTSAPHQAHTDAIMGQYTALIYLNTSEQCRGGTSVLEHELGMAEHPKTEVEENLWKRDMNNFAKWKVTTQCPMAFNRLYLLNSVLFHRSEPVGGFGKTADDGRLVLISFFNIE